LAYITLDTCIYKDFGDVKYFSYHNKNQVYPTIYFSRGEK